MDPRLISYMSGRVYYYAQNRGVYVLMDRQTWQALGEDMASAKEKIFKEMSVREKLGLTLFVFAGDQYHYHRDKWLMGSDEMFFALIALLKKNSAIVINVESRMYVPFSNSDRPKPEEIHLLRRQSDFREVFGLMPEELTKGVRER